MAKMVIAQGLVVRQRVQTQKGAGGVFVPRLFRAEVNDFTHARALKRTGHSLVRESNGLLTVETDMYRLPPDQEWARDYEQACKELDKTPAGKRAEELLMSFLTPEQERTARLYRYIDFFLLHKQAIERRMSRGETPIFKSLIVRFLRGFPNGNIRLAYMEEGRVDERFTICFHPTVPYPNDDIVLAQIVSLLSDPDGFVQEGNVTERGIPEPFHFSGMFGQPETPKLVLPYSQEIESVS